jgi:phage terminase large subunit-like protein
MNPELRELLKSLPDYDPFSVQDDVWRFDEGLAWHAVDFYGEYLTHTKGPLARQPLVLAEFQAVVILNLYGWVHKTRTNAKGLPIRRYQQALIFLPRKNGKSTWVAGMAIYAQVHDPLRDIGGELYSAATEAGQASLVFDQAKQMILNHKDLAAKYRILQRALVVESEGSSYKPISADAKSKHGFNSSFICYDEIHSARDRELYDVLNTSTGARENPLFVMITTSDFDRPSICNEQLEYADKILSGVIKDDRFLPVIYRATIDDDWTDPEVWAKANPNLGVSISMEYMQRECQKAQDIPSYENTFKRLHLNVKTQQAQRWLQLQRWDLCGGPLPDLRGRRCIAGLDLASTTDICAFVLVFEPTEEDPTVYILPYFWVPSEGAREREKRDGVPYATWARSGLIRTTEGNVADYDHILKDVQELAELYEIVEIAIDRWGSQNLQNQLSGAGFEVVPFGQGFASMSPSCKALEKMIIGVECCHGGNEVLRWMASNVAIESDSAENIKFSKKRSTEKIDGMVALAMAIGRLEAQTTAETGSVYDTGGISFL